MMDSESNHLFYFVPSCPIDGYTHFLSDPTGRKYPKKERSVPYLEGVLAVKTWLTFSIIIMEPGDSNPSRREKSTSTPYKGANGATNKGPNELKSFSVYNGPYGIPPPTYSYLGTSSQIGVLPQNTNLAQGNSSSKQDPRADTKPEQRQSQKRQELADSILNWYSMSRSGTHEVPEMSRGTTLLGENGAGDANYSDDDSVRRRGSGNSNNSSDSEETDENNVREYSNNQKEDEEKAALRRMDYRTRRKHIQRIRIQFNVSSKDVILALRNFFNFFFAAVKNRYCFLLKLARALMTFGAPSHRIESQLMAAARILEIEAEFIHLPGMIICSFGEQDLGSSETHFVKCGGRLSLGALHKVHVIYRSVVHDEISAENATEQLEALLNARPPYSKIFRCSLAFGLSALICPLAFGGSFVDMWIAGLAAFILCWLQLHVAEKSALYANVFELSFKPF